MGIKKGLRQHWIDSDDIRDRIDGRVYSGRVPDKGKLPCIVLEIISTSRIYSTKNETGLTESIIQVDIYGDTNTEVDQLAELVRNRTSGYSGCAGDETIKDVLIIRESQTREQPKDGSGDWVYRFSTDYQVFYVTAVPTHV